MSTKDQAIKNLDLSKELAYYLTKNPAALGKSRKGFAFVAFSYTDEKLNEENEKLIPSLMKEGKRVIKAIQSNDKFNPWKFFPVASI